MDLRRYLDEREISIPAFAATIGVSVQSVHRYLGGDRMPLPQVLERIKRATGDLVQPNDFHLAVIAKAPAEPQVTA